MINKKSKANHINNKKQSLKVSAFFFLVAVTMIAFWFFMPRFQLSPILIGIYLFILGLLAIIILWGAQYLPNTNEEDGNTKWLHAPVLITIYIILWVGLPGLLSMYLEEELLTSLETLVGIDWDYFVWGWAVILLGTVCLWLGYRIGLRLFRPIHFLMRMDEQFFSFSLVMMVYALLFGIEIISISVIGIGFGANRTAWGVMTPFAKSIDYLGNIKYVILALSAILVFKGKWPQKVLIILLFSEIILAVSSGFMKPMLRIALIILAAAYYSNIRLGRLYRYIGFFLILGILTVPIIQNLRFQYGTYNNRSILGVLQVVPQAYEDSWGGGVERGTDMFSDKMGGRQATVAHMVGIIVKKTPEIVPYRGLDKFLIIPTYIIPRFLWPNKPTLSSGTWFSVTYLNMPLTTNSSSAMTIFGEAYTYAGWISVVIGLFAFGLLLSFVYRNTVNTGMVAVYIAMIPQFIDTESQLNTQLVGILQTFVVYIISYLVLLALSKKRWGIGGKQLNINHKI